MAGWDEFTAECPNCGGDGCDICEGGGKLVVPSKVIEYTNGLRKQLHEMRKTRYEMLDVYRRWVLADESQVDNIMKLVATAVYDDPEMYDRREFDVRMTEDILEIEDRLEHQKTMIETGERVSRAAREHWQAAKREAKRRNAPPPPPPMVPKPPPKKTKAAGKVCRYPHCEKDPYVTDEKGRGWCKKHAYERGLLDRPKQKKEDDEDQA